MNTIISHYNFIADYAYSAAKTVTTGIHQLAAKTSNVYSRAKTAFYETYEQVEHGIKVGKKVYSVINDPQKHLVESIEKIDIKELIKKSYTDNSKKRLELFFDNFKQKQNYAITRKLAAHVEKRALKAHAIFSQEVTSPAQEKAIQLILSKIAEHSSEEKARKVAFCLFQASGELIKMIDQALIDTDKSQIKAKFLGLPIDHNLDVEHEFEEKKKSLELRVNKNICNLIGSSRKEAKLFTWKHLAALIAYIAVRFFGYGLDVLKSTHFVTEEELKKHPKIYDKLEGCSEFLFLKLLESMTNLIQTNEPVSEQDLDKKWDDLAEISSPHISQLISSSLQDKSIFLRGAVIAASAFLGGPAPILSKIRPSQVIPVVLEKIKAAAQ